MTVTAKVICDSISPEGIRLTTLQLRYPRMVHADFMTHRVFSRNGRSSRAVPFATLVKEEPYVPLFMKNKPGMVASEHFDGDELDYLQGVWIEAANACKFAAQKLANANVHKQWVNRMLEWFGYIDVLVTSTDWANFFELRNETGAQPEIQELAKAIKLAMDNSIPNKLRVGKWHLPYITIDDLDNMSLFMGEICSSCAFQMGDDDCACDEQDARRLETLKMISVARCARLTIKPFDGNSTIEAELERYDKLMVSRPVHASPAEHIATPDTQAPAGKNHKKVYWQNPKEHGNFRGWRQFRKMIPYNTIND